MVGHSYLQPLFSGDNSERTQKLRQDFEREVDESGAANVFVISELFTAPRNLQNFAQGNLCQLLRGALAKIAWPAASGCTRKSPR
jgi:hypothetical protein